MDTDFAKRLLAWWDTHGRKDFPWQRDRSPYRIWVAEVMLQQTQAATAISYFERFTKTFANVDALASAELDEVLHLWSGLGYYSRARNLHRAAQIIVREHGGELPSDPAELITLPGIGRSTAGAIAAQAHGRRTPILDANVKRVLARFHRIAGDVTSAATLRVLWAKAEEALPEERIGDYTQAIMDLGAVICKPRGPRCDECPQHSHCAAFAHGDWQRFPTPRAKRSRRLERRRFFVVVEEGGACLVHRRPPSGVWAGLWSPPERSPEHTVEEFLTREAIPATAVRQVSVAPRFRHGFTHFELEIEPVVIRIDRRPATVSDGDDVRWVMPGQSSLGFSVVATKLMASTDTEFELK